MSPQHKALLAAFQRGEHLTVASAMYRCGVYALSQRIGELKRLGHAIKGEMVNVGHGKRVKVYWMDNARVKAAAEGSPATERSEP